MVDEQQEPFRSMVDRLGLIVYSAAILVGGPLIVAAKRVGPEAEAPLRILLAGAATVGAALLARRARGLGRLPLVLAAAAAFLRTLIAGTALELARLPGALVEGSEMALVAIGLALLAPEDDVRTRAALFGLAVGAVGLKVAWGLEHLTVVRYGGLVLLPLALLGLRGIWPARR